MAPIQKQLYFLKFYRIINSLYRCQQGNTIIVCRYGLVVEQVLPKHLVRVRFPLLAPEKMSPWLFFYSSSGYEFHSPLPLAIYRTLAGRVVSDPDRVSCRRHSRFVLKTCHRQLFFTQSPATCSNILLIFRYGNLTRLYSCFA